ncbi:hypothetical protein PPERSA_03146 [Pseudocohnilembus persalinus]|uniref:Uncharacterized protein n=1 Tax=Pseudocohnilembus persalinus TaxID=266149 RepID=A0A0V0QIM6_PSEPJ|nr:hypothetical protein PPERSA_03146 [Pseudocohnilembus persalinus]|eukprot:KRX02084.1 hypothetical protein PPERSA_03146 [Pseudocohnilembus persalinus]
MPNNLYQWKLYDYNSTEVLYQLPSQNMTNENINSLNKQITFFIKDLQKQDLIKIRIFDIIDSQKIEDLEFAQEITLKIENLLDQNLQNKRWHLKFQNPQKQKQTPTFLTLDILYDFDFSQKQKINQQQQQQYNQLINVDNQLVDPVYNDNFKQILMQTEDIPFLLEILPLFSANSALFKQYLSNQNQNHEVLLRDMQRSIYFQINLNLCEMAQNNQTQIEIFEKQIILTCRQFLQERKTEKQKIWESQNVLDTLSFLLSRLFYPPQNLQEQKFQSQVFKLIHQEQGLPHFIRQIFLYNILQTDFLVQQEAQEFLGLTLNNSDTNQSLKNLQNEDSNNLHSQLSQPELEQSFQNSSVTNQKSSTNFNISLHFLSDQNPQVVNLDDNLQFSNSEIYYEISQESTKYLQIVMEPNYKSRTEYITNFIQKQNQIAQLKPNPNPNLYPNLNPKAQTTIYRLNLFYKTLFI